MEPESTIPPAPQPEPEQHVAHTYEDDLSKAMNATDATEVQGLLAHAREQEAEAVMEKEERRERKWYSTSSTLLIILTLAVLGFGTYYYMSLTVPVQPVVSVGVFPTTDPIATNGTDITSVLNTIRTSNTLTPGKPVLLTLVTDTQSNTALTMPQLYSFIGADVPASIQSVIASAKVGVVSIGTDVLPFVVASVPDPESASRALTDAEGSLPAMFAQLLNGTPRPTLPTDSTDSSQQSSLSALVASQQSAQTATPQVAAPIVSPTFQSQYFYNLPVRSLTATDPATGQEHIVFLYGYATNNVLVIASTPEVLKAVYDTVITQH